MSTKAQRLDRAARAEFARWQQRLLATGRVELSPEEAYVAGYQAAAGRVDEMLDIALGPSRGEMA